MRTSFIALALLLAPLAMAGPKIPKAQLKQLPEDVLSRFEAGETVLDELDADHEKALVEAEHAQTKIKADKMQLKALKSKLDADKAAKKAAKEAKDKGKIKATKAQIEATELEITAAEGRVRAASALAKLEAERAQLIEAERDVKEAELRYQQAQAIYDAELEIDVNIYEAAVSKVKIKFEEARADVMLAEAKVSGKGGDPMGEEAPPAQ